MSTTNFSITLKNETLQKLDKKRDLIPRSSYIERILAEHLAKTRGTKK